MNAEAARRIAAARTALVLDEPFFGVLSLRLRVVEDPTCDTAWVDGRSLGYNPDFINGLTHAEVVGVLVHEVMHCACGHPWRRDSREPRRWNEACDYAINPIVADAGHTLPDNVLLDAKWAGKSAEWIFDRLPSQAPQAPQAPQEPQDGSGQGGDAQDSQGGAQGDASGDPSQGGQPSPDAQGGQPQDGNGGQDAQDGPRSDDGSSPGAQGRTEVRDAPVGAEAAEAEATEADWTRAVQEAARAAEARGSLPGSMKRFAAEAAEPVVDWRSVLRRFMQEVSASDYSWLRPNPRYLAAGMYLPALRAEGMGPLVVAIDTSGSIDDVLLGQFEAEVNAIVDECSPERVHVVWCDSRVKRIDTFERGDLLDFQPVGGGGTDFRPVFRAVESLDAPPAALIYLTDLLGSFPQDEPEYPVLWAATTTRRTAPFGETVPVL